MEKYIILGLETTSMRGSVAMIVDGQLIEEIELGQRLRHSNFIIPAVNDLLKKHKLSLKDVGSLAVGIGPGSFTGIRVGIAVAKGLAFDNEELTISGIPSLLNIALNCPSHPEKVMSVVYAQRGEFFVQEFRKKSDNFYSAGTECAIKEPADIVLSAENQQAVICGPDIKRFLEMSDEVDCIVKEPVSPTGQKAALCVSMVTESNDYSSLNPIYIRRSEAEMKGPKEYSL